MTLVLNIKSSILGKRLDNVVNFYGEEGDDFVVAFKDGKKQSIPLSEIKNIQILP